MAWMVRAAEAEVRTLVERGARLVVVQGLGGVGTSAVVQRALEGRAFVRIRLRTASSAARRAAALAPIVVLDDVHDARDARAVAAFVACARGLVVVASRVRLGLSGELCVRVPILTGEEARALVEERLNELGVREVPEEIAALTQASGGWPVAIEALVTRARLVGAAAATGRFLEELDGAGERCRLTLDGAWEEVGAKARVLWAAIGLVRAALEAQAWLDDPGVGDAAALERLVDRGLVTIDRGHARMAAPVAAFARSKMAANVGDRAHKACTRIVLARGEAALETQRSRPIETLAKLEVLRADLLALACDEDPDVSVRAALALVPVLAGRLDRAEVLGLYERARRLSVRVSEKKRAAVELALVRTLVARGDHEVALRILQEADVLDRRADTRARRLLYFAHLAAWRGELDEATRLLDAIVAPEDSEEFEDARVQRIFVALLRGELDEVQRLARVAVDAARRRPSPRVELLARRLAAEGLLGQGLAWEAASILGQCRDELVKQGDHAGALFLSSRIIEALRAAGHDAEAEAEARHASLVAARAGEATLELTVLAALGGTPGSWARVADLAWRAQVPLLREQALRWLAARAPGEAPPLLLLSVPTRTLTLRGQALRLARRPILWRLVEALAVAHETTTALGADALFAAGWPADRAAATSRRKRVQTALWTLRKELLGELLETRPEGYALAASMQVRLERA